VSFGDSGTIPTPYCDVPVFIFQTKRFLVKKKTLLNKRVKEIICEEIPFEKNNFSFTNSSKREFLVYKGQKMAYATLVNLIPAPCLN